MSGLLPTTLTGLRLPSAEPSTVSPVKFARVTDLRQVKVLGTATTVSAEDLAAPDNVLRVLLNSTGSAGYSSYQPKYSAVGPAQAGPGRHDASGH
jgi:hypothetical protein